MLLYMACRLSSLGKSKATRATNTRTTSGKRLCVCPLVAETSPENGADAVPGPTVVNDTRAHDSTEFLFEKEIIHLAPLESTFLRAQASLFGMGVRIQNTFIDVDPEATPSPMRRCHSCPNLFYRDDARQRERLATTPEKHPDSHRKDIPTQLGGAGGSSDADEDESMDGDPFGFDASGDDAYDNQVLHRGMRWSIRNYGNTCYFNAAVHCLFHTDFFQTCYQNHQQDPGRVETLTHVVMQLYERMHGQEMPDLKESVISSLDLLNLNRGTMYDASEVLETLMRTLADESVAELWRLNLVHQLEITRSLETCICVFDVGRHEKTVRAHDFVVKSTVPDDPTLVLTLQALADMTTTSCERCMK